MTQLTKAEEMVLLSVMRLKEQAYGVAIKQDIKEITDKSLPYGTLYFLLDKLTVKLFVDKELGESTAERGGRRKTFYQITASGIDALKSAFDQQSRAWTNFASMDLHEGFGK
ncbi:helix-turn-helix transcriptional regulator [bacterium]|nr:helix-turn-helix transcriptional regulator [bacterium]